MIKKYLALLMPVLMLAAFASSTSAGLPDQPADGVWPVVALPIGLEITAPGKVTDRSPNHPGLDSVLADLAEARDRTNAAEATGLRLEDGRVQTQVILAPEAEAAARASIAAAGGEVTGTFENTLQAWLPPEQLSPLASLPAINYIQAPDIIVIAEEETPAVTSEGLGPANAAEWHTAGWRGQGVRVAVIDGGFQGYPSKLGHDLPQNVVVKNFVDSQPDAEVDATTRHGTACAEIVHDMAPLAELYLLKIATDVDLNEAVDYAISQGVDVISTSLTFVNVTPGDGTGRFATITQKAREAGILWVTAAGNYRETHWSGAFIDGDGDNLHEFAPGVEVNVFGPGNNTAFQIPAGVILSPSIRWSDWTVIDQDFRLLLLRHNGSAFEIVSSSNNPQTGLPGQRPTERTTFITGGAPAIYGVAIQRVDAERTVHFHLLTPNRELDRRSPAMSLGNLADAPLALTAAAVDVDVPFIQEDYSSEGPINGPGGAPSGGQRKPDLAAFANVSTASYGTRAFNGTSAATPHIAGAAAQVLSACPTASPGEVQDYLQSRAVNLGAPGADTQFGYGRLWLGGAPDLSDYDFHLFVPFVLATP
jgi:subtilisin family serine protease